MVVTTARTRGVTVVVLGMVVLGHLVMTKVGKMIGANLGNISHHFRHCESRRESDGTVLLCERQQQAYLHVGRIKVEVQVLRSHNESNAESTRTCGSSF